MPLNIWIILCVTQSFMAYKYLSLFIRAYWIKPYPGFTADSLKSFYIWSGSSMALSTLVMIYNQVYA